jgi:hypothetical protein
MEAADGGLVFTLASIVKMPGKSVIVTDGGEESTEVIPATSSIKILTGVPVVRFTDATVVGIVKNPAPPVIDAP